ncbi:MAG: amino acid ABC transporter substrate-binding protein [Pseudomonadaceae bacterium]|nr:amino acid ABC transporter substrate-binding protein [Pseudomonadaceae bacterium]
MKQIATVFLAVLASLLAVYVLGAKGGEGRAVKESAYERVLRTGVLRCGYASFGTNLYKDPNTGEIGGYTADIARAVAKELGLEVEWTAEVGFADFAEGLKNAHYDMFCGPLSMIPARSRVATFLDPYLYMPFYVYVRTGEDRFRTFEALNDPAYTYGSTDGEVFQKISRKKFPLAKENALPNMSQPAMLFLDLAARKSDFLVQDLSAYRDYVSNNPGKIQVFLNKPLEVNAVAFAVAKGEDDLEDMLNVAVHTLVQNGVVDNILSDYGYSDKDIFRVQLPIRSQ